MGWWRRWQGWIQLGHVIDMDTSQDWAGMQMIYYGSQRVLL